MHFILKIIILILNKINPKRIGVFNLYSTNFSKRVLISYITYPFYENFSGHSNIQEAIEIAKIFHDMNYIVDIINYKTGFKKICFPNVDYDIVFGLEPNFIKAVDKFKPKKSIYYATGSHYLFQNNAERIRLKELEKRKGKALLLRRTVMSHSSSEVADAVICIGNDQTKKTYDSFCKKIEMIRVSAYSFFPYPNIEKEKKWESAKKNFLWFGSAGAVHKGLDLLLDIFKDKPYLHLYICGNISAEKDFVKLYEKELSELSNIHLVGFIRPNSTKFREIVNTCAFAIMPSCSEGMNSSVPTCMHSGLIPLVSRECGLDIGNIGVIFYDNKIETIEKIILEYSKKEDPWIRMQSEKAYIFAKENNTIDIFKKDFKRALNNIL